MAVFSARDCLVVSLCVIIHLIYRSRRRKLPPLPPGPRRWPIVKNTFTIPLTNAHGYYKELGTKLDSKILYLEALGRSMLVINDISIAQELLEKRSALYSSRPRFPMLHDVIGIQTFFGTMPYGDYWRTHRRMFQQYFTEKYFHRTHERIVEFIRKGLLTNVLESPDHFDQHLKNCVGGLSLSITYGLPIERKYDPLVRRTEETLATAGQAIAPGRFLVNVIPSLKHIPEWMPGADFKRVAKEVRADLTRMTEESFVTTLKMMEHGTTSTCFVTETLERHRQSPDYEHQVIYTKQTASQVFSAASETVVTTIKTFILGMLQRPDVLRKAQKEVDDIVGPERLPDPSDIPHLPYLSAIVKEILRWNPTVPLGVPHCTDEDDEYMGYLIPKGCIVFANTYAMLHDDEIFPEPKEFKPERFLKDGFIRDDLPDPEHIATFGFGRRICPGSRIGLSALYIAAASILHLFDIAPALDEDGNIIKVVPQFMQASITSEPLPFQFKITPREGRDVDELLRDYIGTEPI